MDLFCFRDEDLCSKFPCVDQISGVDTGVVEDLSVEQSTMTTMADAEM